MINSGEPYHNDYFSKIWKSPIRRWWRYARRLGFTFILGIGVWGALNFGVIFLNSPVNPSPASIILHTTLTIGISCLLAILSHYLYLRNLSRFRPVRVFNHTSGKSDG